MHRHTYTNTWANMYNLRLNIILRGTADETDLELENSQLLHHSWKMFWLISQTDDISRN